MALVVLVYLRSHVFRDSIGLRYVKVYFTRSQEDLYTS
jgi:hypothetical protein